jgi:hypothetical protein
VSETKERVGHANGFIVRREAILAAFICVSDERKELIYMSMRLLSTKGHPMRNEASREQGDEDIRMKLKDGEVSPINRKTTIVRVSR